MANEENLPQIWKDIMKAAREDGEDGANNAMIKWLDELSDEFFGGDKTKLAQHLADGMKDGTLEDLKQMFVDAGKEEEIKKVLE